MQYWQTFWLRISSPSEHIRDSGERQRASLFSALMFVLTVFLGIATVIFTFSPTMTMPFRLINLAAMAVYLFTYILSRSRYYRWAVRIFVWSASLAAFYPYLFLEISIPERALSYIALVILVAGIGLSLKETFVTFVILEVLLVIVINNHSDNPSTIFYIPNLVASVGVLSIVSLNLNNFYRRRAVESETRYRELMKANNEGILIIDEHDAHILDANAAIETLLGYTPEEIIGRFPVEFVDASSKASIWRAWHKRNQGVPLETLALCKDGSTIYIEVILKPYQYLNKNAYVVTLLDVSERKQVEALVIESEKRFRAIFNETSHFIGVLDTEGKILELNEQGLEFFGLTVAEALGKPIWEIKQWAHNEKSRERIRQVLAEARQGHTMRYEVEVRDRHNKPAFLDFTLKPVQDIDGTVTMLIADSRDITDYKNAEQKRLEYERRYDALFTNTADAVFVFTLEGKYIAVNQRALDMLGYSREEIIGKPTSLAIVPEEFPQASSVLDRLLSGEEFDVYERKLRRKNGEIFSVEISAMLVRDVDNKPMYFQSLVRDISERKRMERQALEMALEKERAKLLQAFIEQASHHFRTPLTNLKTSFYLLPRFYDKPDKRQQHMSVIEQELTRLQTLLDDLLTVVRLQKTDTELKLAKIPVKQFLSELRANQEGRANYHHYDWHWEIVDDEAHIIGDKHNLGRAFLNLLENATLYTANGGKISIHSEIRDKWLAIAVVDSGIGIEENDLPHIFQDFFRGQKAMSINTTSSGLGLTICKYIIERHQGTIQVESRVGEGSRFEVLLPLYNSQLKTPTTFNEWEK